jgi:hypothetical protein
MRLPGATVNVAAASAAAPDETSRTRPRQDDAPEFPRWERSVVQAEQIVQILGALAILAAFVLAQWRVIDARSLRYLVPNLVGSTVLAVDAYLGAQWGFVLLEGVWAIVSGVGVVTRAARGSNRSACT